MKKFQEKKNFREIMQSRPALVLISIILIAFAWNVVGLMGRMQETAKNKKIEEGKILELKERKEKLITDIAGLKTEKGVEESIREKFGLVKEGEDVIVIVEEKEKEDPNLEDKKPFRFFSIFKNIF